MIFTDIFGKLCYICSIPDIDLFASRFNKQLGHYASRLPDPGSSIIGAMPVSLHGQHVYIFPPFSFPDQRYRELRLLAILFSKNIKEQKSF